MEKIPAILTTEELIAALNKLREEHQELRQHFYNHVYDSPGMHTSPFSKHWQREEPKSDRR
jgi:hypothetical protein